MNKLIEQGLMSLMGQLGQLMIHEEKEFQILRPEFACDVQTQFVTNLPEGADEALKEVQVELAYMQRQMQRIQNASMENLAKIVKKATLAKNRDNIAMWAAVSKLSRTDTDRMSDEFRLAVEVHRRRALEKQLKDVMEEAEGALKKMMQVTEPAQPSSVTC